MKFADYNYIATMIGDFSGVPVHIYKNYNGSVVKTKI